MDNFTRNFNDNFWEAIRECKDNCIISHDLSLTTFPSSTSLKDSPVEKVFITAGGYI